ncbi:MAG: 3-isopropylmalate dehydratase small subunit [Betaproteobacteria bacterium]|nr:3-isopropylmalate dehydratase small subunit [Betaproteobacteria bacterium]
MKFEARVWKFPANINTDLILPSGSIYLSQAEQVQLIFKANRPGWVDLVKPGDIIVAGKNFGLGSSRPASRSLKNLGVSCVLAESINGLFFRNCVNYAFPAMECAGVADSFAEGDICEVDFADGNVRNRTSGKSLQAKVLPEKLLDLLKAGGIYPLLEMKGIIEPQT